MSDTSIETSTDIAGYECKHAVYVKDQSTPRDRVGDDAIFIKERIHYSDGSTKPNVRMIKNYRRPFWVTKPAFRNHQEKKEWEDLDKLDYYECTQAELIPRIKKALGLYTPVNSLRRLARSPYLYGADISPTALVKHQYISRYPNCESQNTVAVLDIETDVIHGTNEPILVSVSFKDRAVIGVVGWFFRGIKNPKKALLDHYYQRLPETAKERNLEPEIFIHDDILTVVEHVIGRCHEWQPDFLSIWNIDFDIPKILELIQSRGGDPARIFSDPRVPDNFKYCRYKQGAAKKIKSNGDEEPLQWFERWHTLYAPASFYVIDQAAVFHRLRIANGKEPSYALDAILTKYAGIKKLKNSKADGMSGFEWHIYMQSNEPLEYAIYNLYDCISCEILDEQPKVGDLRLTISAQCGHSDYANFASQPRRTVDNLHFVCLKNGKAIGTTADEMKSDWDHWTVSTYNWIVTLPAHLVADNGLQVIEEAPELRTLIRTAVYDLDVTSAYPNGEDILNASKETTIAEVNAIEGVSHEVQRLSGLNLTGGSTNATEVCAMVMGAPCIEQLIEDLEQNGFCD